MNSIWTTGRTSLGLGWAQLVFGAWLIISPFALGFAKNTGGTANNIIVGIVLILLTLVSTRNGLLKGLWILLAGWVYISGFTIEVNHTFLLNNLMLALLIIVTSVASETPYPPNYRPPQ